MIWFRIQNLLFIIVILIAKRSNKNVTKVINIAFIKWQTFTQNSSSSKVVHTYGNISIYNSKQAVILMLPFVSSHRTFRKYGGDNSK